MTHCEHCRYSYEWSRRQPVLLRLDEALHRFECRHGVYGRRFVWRIFYRPHGLFCDYIDVKFHGMDRLSNPRQG